MNYFTRALKSTPALLLFSGTIILLLFNLSRAFTKLFGRPYLFLEPLTQNFMVLYSMALMLALPLVIAKFIYKDDLRDLGLRLPENSLKTWFLIIASLSILLPSCYYFAHMPPVIQYYSMKKLSLIGFLYFLLIAMPPYYLAEEFFFRGFLFLTLHKKIGWQSYWVTEIIYTYAHIGKPWIEVIFSFPAGLILNYITLKTRSIFPSILVHYILGAMLNVWVTYWF